MPERIQRQRTKGWRMPPNTVYVGRPTKWGNPYEIKRYGLELCLAVFRETAQGCWNPTLIDEATKDWNRDTWHRWMYQARNMWIERFDGQHPAEAAIVELRGRNLACWCPLSQPCHADILLEIANG